jgi:RNA polymerase sigma-70 factor, ECF subfamily
MIDGPASGLRLLDALAADGTLPASHLLAAARADMFRRLGRHQEAADAYRAALALVGNEPERRFLEGRLAAAEAGRENPGKQQHWGNIARSRP